MRLNNFVLVIAAVLCQAQPPTKPRVDGRENKIVRDKLVSPAHRKEIERKREIAHMLRKDGFQIDDPPAGDPASRPTVQEIRARENYHHGIVHGSADDILPIGGPASGDLRPTVQLQDAVSTEADSRQIPISYIPLPMNSPQGSLDTRTEELIGTEPCEETHIAIDIPGPQGNAEAPTNLPSGISDRELPIVPHGESEDDYTEPAPDGNGVIGVETGSHVSVIPGVRPSPGCPSPEELEQKINQLVQKKLSEMERDNTTTAQAEIAEEGSPDSDLTSEQVTEEDDSTSNAEAEKYTTDVDSNVPATVAEIVLIPPKEEDVVTTESQAQDATEWLTEYFVYRQTPSAPLNQTTLPTLVPLPATTAGSTTTTTSGLVTLINPNESTKELPTESPSDVEEVLGQPDARKRQLQAVFRKVIAPPLAPSFARLQNLVDNVAKTPLTDDQSKDDVATAAELLPCLLRPGGCVVDNLAPTDVKPTAQGQSAVLKKTQSQIAKAVTKLQKDLDMRTAEVVKEIERRAAEMRREIAQEAEQVIEAVKYLVTILADSVTRADEMGAGFVREWFDDAEHRYVGNANSTALIDQEINSWEADFKQKNDAAHQTMVDKLKSRVEKTREKYGQPKALDDLDVELGLDSTEEETQESNTPTTTTTTKSAKKTSAAEHDTEPGVKQLLNEISADVGPARYGFIDA